MFRTVFGNKILKKVIAIFLIFLCLTIYNKVFAGYNEDLTLTFNWNSSTFSITAKPEVLDLPYIFMYGSGAPYSKAGQFIFVCSEVMPTITEDSSKYTLTFTYNAGQKRRGIGIESINISDDKNYIFNNSNCPIYQSANTIYYYIYKNQYNYGYNNNYSYYSNYDIYLNNNILFAKNFNTFEPPSLSNSISDLQNLSFNNFIINANDYTNELENNDGTLYMLFYNRSMSNSQNTDGLYPIQEKAFTKGSIYTDYDNSTSSNMIFSYPIFKSGVFFTVGSTYEIRFAKKSYNSEYNTDFYEFFDNSYTFTISSNVTQDYINQINQQTATTTDEENQQNIENALNNQTQSIDNLNSSITNSTVDNSSIDLPTDNTNNPTQDGINNIFQIIYNGFTKGTPKDIVFPLPYSTQNITIQPNYVSQMLNSSERWKNSLFSDTSILLVYNQ